MSIFKQFRSSRIEHEIYNILSQYEVDTHFYTREPYYFVMEMFEKIEKVDNDFQWHLLVNTYPNCEAGLIVASWIEDGILMQVDWEFFDITQEEMFNE